jgi:Tol biopolymer transport system component
MKARKERCVMKLLNCTRIRIVLVGVVAAIVLDAGNVKADFTFGEPVNLGPVVNSPGIDASPVITPDGLQLYFGSDREGGSGGVDLWMSTRPTKDAEWGEPVNLGDSFNTSDWDIGPSLSSDGMEFYFNRLNYDEWTGGLWVAKRASIDDPWGEPTNLGPTVNSASDSIGPCISHDGLTLFFYSDRSGTADVWMTTRPTLADPWSAPVNLGFPVNDESWDYWPHITSNGLALLFCSDREGGNGNEDVWMARRSSVSDPWGTPINLRPPANTDAWDTCPFVSADGLTYYFVSDREGGQGSYDLWQAPIIPIVDLNGDGIVDAADMCIVVDHWGTDDTLCDIGPTPFGDGVVDVQDLIVLAEHLFEEFPPEEVEPVE